MRCAEVFAALLALACLFASVLCDARGLVTLDRSEYDVGGDIVVSFSTSNFKVGDRIAMYVVGDDSAVCDCLSDASCYKASQRISSTSLKVAGKFTFRAPAYIQTSVFFRYLDANDVECGKSASVSISAAVDLVLPGLIQVGVGFTVRFSAPAGHSSFDYISVHNADDDSELCREFVPRGPSGHVILKFSKPCANVHVRYHSACKDNDPNPIKYIKCEKLHVPCKPAPPTPPPVPCQCTMSDIEQEDVKNAVVFKLFTQPITVIAGSPYSVSVYQSGLPATAQLVPVSTSPKGAGYAIVYELQYTPDFKDASTNYYVCVVAIDNSTNSACERQCFWINVGGEVCTVWGDPHVVTYDSLTYNFQEIGDFVLAQTIASTQLSVQARFVDCGFGVTCTRGIAIREGINHIEVLFDWRWGRFNMTVNGQFIDLRTPILQCNQDKYGVSLPGAIGRYTWDRIAKLFTLRLRSGLAFKVSNPNHIYPVITLLVPGLFYRNNVAGICGTWSNCECDDYTLEDGVVVSQSAPLQSVHDRMLGWRVTEPYSEFNYGVNNCPDYRVWNQRISKFFPLLRAVTTDPELQALANTACGAFYNDSSVAGCVEDVIFDQNLHSVPSYVAAQIIMCEQKTDDPAQCQVNANCSALGYCSYLGVCTEEATCACFVQSSASQTVYPNCTIELLAGATTANNTIDTSSTASADSTTSSTGVADLLALSSSGAQSGALASILVAAIVAVLAGSLQAML